MRGRAVGGNAGSWSAKWKLGWGALIGTMIAFAGVGPGNGPVAATTGDLASRGSLASTRSAVATPDAGVFARYIKHVVVFYQENHSFDETLGRFCQLQAPRCDGYTGPVRLRGGTVVQMRPSSDLVPGVFHTVVAQSAAIDGGKMDGWANVGGCNRSYRYRCLTYYSPDQVPNLTTLAAHFVVSDRTFSMAQSPSWGGHVYAAAATRDNFTGENPIPAPHVKARIGWGCSSDRVTPWVNPTSHKRYMAPSCIPARPGMLNSKKYPYNGAFRWTPAKYVPTIFDRLDAKHVSWKLYSSVPYWSICPSFAECQYGPQHRHLVPTVKFLSDAKNNRLPAYSVLLPSGPGGTSQHDPGSMLRGDNWIGKVIATLEHSPEWSSTAVFITYDDCGCFYDHVAPGTNPDHTRQGIRVPMVIVSPYAKVAYTDSQPATFASILRFAEKTFGLPALTVNDQYAYDYANSFDFSSPPTGPRANLSQHPLSAASLNFLATHTTDTNDPT